ncbi:MAG TPA: hypothetical protein VF150_06525, partial [Thermoanaerobaculia bacterium]
MEPLSWLRTLASRRFEILAGVAVAFFALDLALDLSGALGTAGHSALSASLALLSLTLLLGSVRARRRADRERRQAEAEHRRLEER